MTKSQKKSGPQQAGQPFSIEQLKVTHSPDLPAQADLPRVTVVVLNHNGRHHLKGCFDSLAQTDYPKDRLDVLLVDNGSDDGSHEEMREQHGWVRFHANPNNLGFAGGCNQGVELSPDAEMLVFLNNDMRVEPDFLTELVAPIVRRECHATTGKMYSWDGKLMNSAGGGMNFYGIGIQHGYLREPGPEYDQPRKSLFPCGGAMAISAELYREVGGFDTQYFAYYEDVDLGWRLWVLGYETHYAPKAKCYHHHSSTSRAFPGHTVRLLQTRNPVLTCVKNYDDENLKRMLPALLALHARRTFIVSGLGMDDRPFRIEQASVDHKVSGQPGWFSRLRKKLPGMTSINSVGAADLVGINDFLGNWDHWMKRRADIQTRRKRSDEEIFKLFLKPQWCIEEDPGYSQLQAGLEELYGLDQTFAGLSIDDPDPNK